MLLGISRSLSQSQNTLTLNTLFLNKVDVLHTEYMLLPRTEHTALNARTQ